MTLRNLMDDPSIGGAHKQALQRRSRDKLDRVLGVTRDLLIAEGLQAVSTTAVAARAAISAGWLYTYFENRDALLEEILIGCLRGLDEAMDDAGLDLGGPDWRRHAHAGSQACLDYFDRDAAFRGLWFSDEFNGHMLKINRLHDDAMAAWLASTVTDVREGTPPVSMGVVTQVYVGMDGVKNIVGPSLGGHLKENAEVIFSHESSRLNEIRLAPTGYYQWCSRFRMRVGSSFRVWRRVDESRQPDLSLLRGRTARDTHFDGLCAFYFSSNVHYCAHMTTTNLPPFHLALPVHDIDAARHFYGEVLGFDRGRSADRRTDWNVDGHQVVTHQVDGHINAVAGTNPVDRHQVPVPHFGLVLSVDRFQQLAAQLAAVGTDFVIEPYVRFEGEPGEQWTMFFLDPSGNALEFKAFRDLSQLFAV